MKKKILVIALALVMAMPVFASAKKKTSVNANNDNNASFTLTSVTPAEMNNDVANVITITGDGFTGITAGVKLGQWEGNSKDDTDDTFLLTNVSVVDDDTITATVPVGAPAEEEQDLTVFDSSNNTHATLNNVITIHPMFTVSTDEGDNDGIMEVYQSSSKSASAVFSLTVLGKKFKNKRWLKLRVGGKKAVITKITRSGENTIVRAKFKYANMAVNSYNIALTYKDRLKYGVARKNKMTYRNMWERGTITMNDAFSVMLQSVQ